MRRSSGVERAEKEWLVPVGELPRHLGHLVESLRGVTIPFPCPRACVAGKCVRGRGWDLELSELRSDVERATLLP